MMMTQLLPALSVLGQSSTPRNPVESSPMMEATLKLEKVTILVPVLVTETVDSAVLPLLTVPKLKLDGENFSVPPVAAVTETPWLTGVAAEYSFVMPA